MYGNNFNINTAWQEARNKLDNEFREKQNQINKDYQDRMNNLASSISQSINNYPTQQPQQQMSNPQQMPVNSEIQNAFMKSEAYQNAFNSTFQQFLIGTFFNQFSATPYYAELKKYADNAYPEFERNWIAQLQAPAAQVIDGESKVTNNKKMKENGTS